MASSLKNLSDYNINSVPEGRKFKIGIVVSEWNYQITQALMKGAIETLILHKVDEDNILVKHVPGTFELPLGAQLMADYSNADAILCLGCVIQGETRHFEFICQGVTQGIMALNQKYGIPIIFGVLTTDNFQQALDRSGGIHGNKGVEAAVTALKMAALRKSFI